MLLIIALCLGVGSGLVGAATALHWANRGRIRVDLPTDRGLHTTPTPRGGGIGIPLAGIIGAALAVSTTGLHSESWQPIAAFLWALANGVIGAIDDRHPLSSPTKFAFQVFAAAITAVYLRIDQISLPLLGSVPLGVAAWPFTIFWLVWMANVFNFMDGLDGLAAGCGTLFFVTFGVIAISAGCQPVAVFAICIAGAMIGFFRYNRPPARIFMGDGGSL
jgi:UDP-N-acetylmuramyl pentapeptide phosphotransferase/UDP-N-acetylglucosamine-1-phosphate transferase